MNPKKIRPTSSETVYLIEQIAKIIDDGYSIVYARKVVCGTNRSIKSQAVMKHPLYLHVLNRYMHDRKYNSSFYWGLTKLKQGPLQDPNRVIDTGVT